MTADLADLITTVPFGATLDRLRQDMPALFEHRDRCVATLRQAEQELGDLHRSILTDYYRDEITRDERDRRGAEAAKNHWHKYGPMRMELDRINRSIADVIMVSPIRRAVITGGPFSGLSEEL